MKTKKKWIKTIEDWYPSIPAKNRSPNKKYDNPLNHMALVVYMMQLSTKEYRVCVWGLDDFGMEFDSMDKKEVNKRYKAIKHFTTKRELELLGFKWA